MSEAIRIIEIHHDLPRDATMIPEFYPVRVKLDRRPDKYDVAALESELVQELMGSGIEAEGVRTDVSYFRLTGSVNLEWIAANLTALKTAVAEAARQAARMSDEFDEGTRRLLRLERQLDVP